MKIIWFIISCLIPIGVKAEYPQPNYHHYTGAKQVYYMSLLPGWRNPVHKLFDESIQNQTVKNGGNITQKFADEVISYYHQAVDAKNISQFTVPFETRAGDEDCRCGLQENFEPAKGLKRGALPYVDMPWVVHVVKTIGGTHRFKCVGTLIDRRHVLTTARCVNTHLRINFTSETMVEDEVIRVALVNKVDEYGFRAYINISQIIVHPKFNHG